MLVSVSERTREVGLLRALGVQRGQVLAVFLTELALLSAVGGLLGLSLGWAAVGLLVEIFPALPESPPPWGSPWAWASSSNYCRPAGRRASIPWWALAGR